MRRTLTNMIVAVGLTLSVAAADVDVTVEGDKDNDKEGFFHRNRDMYPPDTLFFGNELSLDLFGSVSVGQEVIENLTDERVEDNGRLGAGAGLNYFFNRNIGLGADAYTENTGHNFIDNTSASLIIRFPFDKAHLAPYIYGGGGYQFDPTELWFAQAGAGLELRFTRNVGIFVDGRWVFTDAVQDLGVARAGLRLIF
jgi:hypothetical protein